MKDIDFDELDRAVSSVLGQGAVKDDPAKTTAAASDEQTTPKSEVLASPATEDSVEKIPPTFHKTAPSLATKRRGKFMDVMHPSADMGSTNQAPRPVRPVAPLSISEPVQTDQKPVLVTETSETLPSHEPTASLDESTVPVGAEPAPVEALLPDHVGETESHNTDTLQDDANPDDVTRSEPSDSSQSSGTSSSMYVDPLSTEDEEVSETPAEEPDVDLKTNENDDIESSFPEPATTPAQEPVTQQSVTPFLSDTNVDKRPLGGFVSSEAAVTTSENEFIDKTQPQNALPGDSQSAPSVPLPRELQPDVVEVESVQEPEVTSAVVAPDDGRVEGHPLFDTSTYHEPIAAVHGHGMSAWVKWTIGLLICLAIGAGVGYFLFAAGL